MRTRRPTGTWTTDPGRLEEGDLVLGVPMIYLEEEQTSRLRDEGR